MVPGWLGGEEYDFSSLPIAFFKAKQSKGKLRKKAIQETQREKGHGIALALGIPSPYLLLGLSIISPRCGKDTLLNGERMKPNSR